MKGLMLLAWLTQLGLSVAVPLGGFIWLGVWLRDNLGWGRGAFWAGMILGIYCAAVGLRIALKNLSGISGSKKKSKPPVAFNDHD